jgi:hypothetical protein
MSKLVLTIAVGEKFKVISQLTLPTIEEYALKIGAECIVLNDEHMKGEQSPHWLKFKIYDYLTKYERILFLDSDLIIRPDTPNLFELIPDTKFGIFDECPYTPRITCLEELFQVYGWKPPINEKTKQQEVKYYNTGVMVVSRKHRNIFRPPTDYKPLVNNFGEQTFLNYRIQDSGVKVFGLEHLFNRMSCMDPITGENRLNSYIVHYAGCPSPILMEELIKKDLALWDQSAPEYKFKRTLRITVGGGLGDQLCAEPVLRFIRKWYTKETTNIYVFTHWKRLFKHLENSDPGLIISDINGIIPEDTTVYHMETSPKMEQLIWRFISHPMTHPVDYITLSTMRRRLADVEKDIHLEVYPEELEEINQLITNPEEYILVHPGKGWESKTFPAEWWSEVTERLSKSEKVAIIGKYIGEDQGYVEFECPENVLDLRDMISVGGLIALISKAKGVVTNDSAPVHIAGAFDNWIYLIPSCKHPDHVLPYRHGNKYYKAKAIYNKLTCDYIESLPTATKDVTVDVVIGKIEDYLPEPSRVVQEILGGKNG